MAAPVESKVQASTAAAAVSGLALWSLGHWVFKGTVPDVVASWVYVLVPGAVTFAAGYLAKHTDRTAVTVTVTPAPGADLGRQVAAALQRGGYAAGDKTVAEFPPPPPSMTSPPAEKTLITPAAPESDQPGAAGPPPPGSSP